MQWDGKRINPNWTFMLCVLVFLYRCHSKLNAEKKVFGSIDKMQNSNNSDVTKLKLSERKGIHRPFSL